MPDAAPAGPTLRLTVRDRTVEIPLRGALRIGADPRCDVVVRRAELDPIHVRVFPCDAGFAVEDVGAYGASVNGESLIGRRVLRHGDVVAFGLARLEFAAPDSAARSLAPNGRQEATPTAGRRMESPQKSSTIGNGTAHPAAAGGKSNTSAAHVPRPPIAPAFGASAIRSTRADASAWSDPSSHAATPAAKRVCAVCHCEIDPSELQTSCSSCGLPFHADCWQENFGCSAYGCRQVDVLRSGPDLTLAASDLAPTSATTASFAPHAAMPAAATASDESFESLSYDHLLLAASVAAACVSLFTYGVPSWGVAMAAGRRVIARFDERREATSPTLAWSERGWQSAAARTPPPWPWIAAAATGLSAVGALGGFAASIVLYSG